MAEKQRLSLWTIGIVGLAGLVIVILLLLLSPAGNELTQVIRASALLGYLAIFLAIISSAFLRRLVKYFGRPFLHVHHVLSLSGLGLVTLHGIAVAVSAGSLDVFLPVFDSLNLFLVLGGRPAWYLIALAVLAAFARSALGLVWRYVHLLNYVAFWLATAHANLIGVTAQEIVVVRIVTIVFAVAVFVILVKKRLPSRR